MSHGEIVEEGSPADLVQRPGGIFRSMVDETGKANAQALIHLAMRNASTAEIDRIHHHAIPVPGDEEGGEETDEDEIEAVAEEAQLEVTASGTN